MAAEWNVFRVRAEYIEADLTWENVGGTYTSVSDAEAFMNDSMSAQFSPPTSNKFYAYSPSGVYTAFKKSLVPGDLYSYCTLRKDS